MCSAICIDVAADTHVGLVRPNNEDSFAAVPELGLFMVADGMGGRPGGEVASRLAIDTVRACFEQDDPERTWPYARDLTKDRAEVLFAEAVRRANTAVFQKGVLTPTLRGMGTTFAGALVRGPRLYLAHVGDSRVYRFRRGELERLTCDHSVAGDAQRLGVILDDIDPRIAGRLERAVGTHARVDVETRVEFIEPGDTLLLCSDGLWQPVHESVISVMLAWCSRPSAIVAGLIGYALERGGPDNVTCVVVRIGHADVG